MAPFPTVCVVWAAWLPPIVLPHPQQQGQESITGEGKGSLETTAVTRAMGRVALKWEAGGYMLIPHGTYAAHRPQVGQP